MSGAWKGKHLYTHNPMPKLEFLVQSFYLLFLQQNIDTGEVFAIVI